MLPLQVRHHSDIKMIPTTTGSEPDMPMQRATSGSTNGGDSSARSMQATRSDSLEDLDPRAVLYMYTVMNGAVLDTVKAAEMHEIRGALKLHMEINMNVWKEKMLTFLAGPANEHDWSTFPHVMQELNRRHGVQGSADSSQQAGQQPGQQPRQQASLLPDAAQMVEVLSGLQQAVVNINHKLALLKQDRASLMQARADTVNSLREKQLLQQGRARALLSSFGT